MGGVGTFNRVNRTLYISKIQESPDKAQTQETLLRHFGEWGKIVKCKSHFVFRCWATGGPSIWSLTSGSQVASAKPGSEYQTVRADLQGTFCIIEVLPL